MEIGDIVEWTNGVGLILKGEVLEVPRYEGDRPKVREIRNGTILRPHNAKVLHSRNEVIEAGMHLLMDAQLRKDPGFIESLDQMRAGEGVDVDLDDLHKHL